MALPGSVNVNPQSSTQASSGAVSGGDIFLGGNPNLAALVKNTGAAIPWLIGGALVAAVVVVWLWKSR